MKEEAGTTLKNKWQPTRCEMAEEGHGVKGLTVDLYRRE